MATWEDMVRYFHEQGFDVERADVDSMVVRVPVGDAPEPQVESIHLVRQEDPFGDPWMHVEGRLGGVDTLNLSLMTIDLEDALCGGLVGSGLQGGSMTVAFRHSMPLRGIGPELIDIALGSVAFWTHEFRNPRFRH